MSFTDADHVWNRAALESGGNTPGAGDRSLAALLVVHGLIMNGGVHHAIESLEPAELSAAAEGFSYFGFDDVASFLRVATDDPVLSEWTESNEEVANRRYAEMVPDDGQLVRRFERTFRERPDQFAPIDHAR